jgi:hypothetical protein
LAEVAQEATPEMVALEEMETNLVLLALVVVVAAAGRVNRNLQLLGLLTMNFMAAAEEEVALGF